LNELDTVVHSNPEIMSGTPVFVGTRVPVSTLFDYLAAGESLEEFFDNFPGVTHAQVVAAINQAKQLLLDHARSA
jgi:uncharacterized protein (DUF433 family)